MRLRRLIAPVLVGVVLSLVTGCGNASSPAARAWERSSTLTRQTATDPNGPLIACDGLGTVIFSPDAAPDAPVGRSVYAHVPGE